jgi:hypothetical protein
VGAFGRRSRLAGGLSLILVEISDFFYLPFISFSVTKIFFGGGGGGVYVQADYEKIWTANPRHGPRRHRFSG